MPYLKLFHGRKNPHATLEGWGEPGPIFGPFPYFHTTYGAHIQFGEGDCRLTIVSDLVYYAGWFYGDWSVFDGPPSDEDRHRLTEFQPGNAEVPERDSTSDSTKRRVGRYDVHLSVTVQYPPADVQEVDS